MEQLTAQALISYFSCSYPKKKHTASSFRRIARPATRQMVLRPVLDTNGQETLKYSKATNVFMYDNHNAQALYVPLATLLSQARKLGTTVPGTSGCVRQLPIVLSDPSHNFASPLPLRLEVTSVCSALLSNDLHSTPFWFLGLLWGSSCASCSLPCVEFPIKTHTQSWGILPLKRLDRKKMVNSNRGTDRLS